MAILLGVDPGSRVTGYGIIEMQMRPFRVRFIDSGSIRLSDELFADRLVTIFRQLTQVMIEHRPTDMAIEQVFVAHNASSALKLGQARGAAIVAGAHFGLSVSEYSARQVKSAVVGYGGAEKRQVQHMMRELLQLDFSPGADEADGLAIAWCHAHCQRRPQLVGLTR